MGVGDLIIAKMHDLGMTYRDLRDATARAANDLDDTGVTIGTLSMIVQGKTEPTNKTLALLAQVLGISHAQLLAAQGYVLGDWRPSDERRQVAQAILEACSDAHLARLMRVAHLDPARFQALDAFLNGLEKVT